MTHVLLETTLPHAWQHIRAIRKSVGDALAEADPGFRTAAAMVASELVENAVKYGEAVPAAPGIHFALLEAGGQLRIEVSNGCTDGDGVHELQARVKEIARAPDKAALYMARLEALLARPDESGKLGLYRIAFEGKFDLQWSYRNAVVTMTATRADR
jgi:hypothetical protein